MEKALDALSSKMNLFYYTGKGMPCQAKFQKKMRRFRRSRSRRLRLYAPPTRGRNSSSPLPLEAQSSATRT